MNKFKLLLLAFISSLFISACSSAPKEDKQELHICPQCNMELPSSNLHTSTIEKDGEAYYFDDPGCMILWAQKNEISCKSVQAKIFANDSKKYINVLEAFYTINEKTPMLYGFSAYENEQNSTIDFAEVKIRMLRGEHMANPKIRKHILGY